MKLLMTMTIFLSVASAFAQTPQQNPPALSTDPQQIESIIQASGCRYEVSAAAQTIASLQKQINDLQKKLNALDPPKSGATKK